MVKPQKFRKSSTQFTQDHDYVEDAYTPSQPVTIYTLRILIHIEDLEYPNRHKSLRKHPEYCHSS